MAVIRPGIARGLRWASAGWAAGIWLLLAGCVAKPPPPPPPEALPLQQIIDRVNRNNRRIDRVYSAGRVTVRGVFVDEAGRTRHIDLEGSLLYGKPRRLYLDLRHVLRSVMRIGSNRQRYWMWVLLDINKMRWGKYKHLDKPQMREFPLRPDHVIEALGVNELPGEDRGLIGPIRQTTAERNVLIYCHRAAGGDYSAVREYWLDRRWPYLIRRIVLRDRLGQVAMEAKLQDYKPIRGSKALTAKTIRITWPRSRAEIELRLSRRRLRNRVSQRAFSFPTEPPVPPENIIQIDRQYDVAASSATSLSARANVKVE